MIIGKNGRKYQTFFFFFYNFLQLWLLTLYPPVLVYQMYVICPKLSEIHSKQR